MGALSGRWQTLTKAAESFESLIVNLISVPVTILIRCNIFWLKLFFIQKIIYPPKKKENNEIGRFVGKCIIF